MPGYPGDDNDIVHYRRQDHYLTADAVINLLDSAILDITGTVHINGQIPADVAGVVTQINSYKASIAEFYAGNTTKYLTPEILQEGAIAFDVRWFGTVGNGVADDSTAIQNAINAALLVGGVVEGHADDIYGIGAVWPVITGAGTVTVDFKNGQLKGLAGSTVLFEVAGKAGKQAILRNFFINGLGRAVSTSIPLLVRNCQTISFSDFKITNAGVALDQVNDGTGPGSAWNEQNDFERFQINACAISRRMRTINGGADSFAGNKFRANTIGDTDFIHQVLGTASWYGGSESGLVGFLSATGSPVGFYCEGSMEGTSIEGRLESTTANTPTAIQFTSTAIRSNKTRWKLTLTGTGITTLNDATTSGSPMLDIIRTWVPYPEVTVNGKGSRVGFFGKTPTTRPGITADATSIYDALVALGLCEAESPLNLVSFLHAMWADDPDWVRPSDGSPVDYWRNASSEGNPASTGSNRPTMRNSVVSLNNKAALEFVGASSQRLDYDITNQVQPLKYVIVFNSTGGSGVRELYGRGTSGGGIGIDGSSVPRVHYGTQLLGGGALAAGAHVMRVTVNGVSSQIWIDGTSSSTGTTSTGGVGRLTIGASSDATPAYLQFWTGNIAFFGVYSGSIADADLEALEDWLGTYYNITIA